MRSIRFFAFTKTIRAGKAARFSWWLPKGRWMISDLNVYSATKINNILVTGIKIAHLGSRKKGKRIPVKPETILGGRTNLLVVANNETRWRMYRDVRWVQVSAYNDSKTDCDCSLVFKIER